MAKTTITVFHTRANNLLLDSIVLAIMGCIDTLLTSVIADSLTRVEHKSNKELICQDIANLISGLFGGLPGADATIGTIVNIQTGAKTALSGVTRSLVLIIVILSAARLAQNIPMSVLTGIALKVGLDILDWNFLKCAHKVSLKGALIMYDVLFLTIFVDLIVAVGGGLFIANILTIEHLFNLQSKEVKTISDTDEKINLTNIERSLLEQVNGRILLFYLNSPMIFRVAKAISREHSAMRDADALIIDLSDVPYQC